MASSSPPNAMRTLEYLKEVGLIEEQDVLVVEASDEIRQFLTPAFEVRDMDAQISAFCTTNTPSMALVGVIIGEEVNDAGKPRIIVRAPEHEVAKPTAS